MGPRDRKFEPCRLDKRIVLWHIGKKSTRWSWRPVGLQIPRSQFDSGLVLNWNGSSVGRALHWRCRCRRFESCSFHNKWKIFHKIFFYIKSFLYIYTIIKKALWHIGKKCRYRITVITPDFQSGDLSSILSICSTYLILHRNMVSIRQ